MYPEDQLRQEFALRQGRNPNYSLRAFARDLGITPGRLSEYFSQRRRITTAVAAKMLSRLEWPEDIRSHFLAAIESSRRQDRPAKGAYAVAGGSDRSGRSAAWKAPADAPEGAISVTPGSLLSDLSGALERIIQKHQMASSKAAGVDEISEAQWDLVDEQVRHFLNAVSTIISP